jgi:Asp-tRNA(Asn)/Glu-tRNA(Gln) amidotransferase A subunit family amidase
MQDNICTGGLQTTAGSRALQGYCPPFDATAVGRLRAAGAVLIGKTNMDEFGMGSTTENSAYQVRCNLEACVRFVDALEMAAFSSGRAALMATQRTTWG